jgi:hypothetical protein
VQVSDVTIVARSVHVVYLEERGGGEEEEA